MQIHVHAATETLDSYAQIFPMPLLGEGLFWLNTPCLRYDEGCMWARKAEQTLNEDGLSYPCCSLSDGRFCC